MTRRRRLSLRPMQPMHMRWSSHCKFFNESQEFLQTHVIHIDSSVFIMISLLSTPFNRSGRFSLALASRPIMLQCIRGVLGEQGLAY